MTRRKAASAGKQNWLPLLREFMSHLTIESKETGSTRLDKLYGAQERFLEEICRGLDDGVRSFSCLKARQLGITTVSLAIDLFWLSMHNGLQGALITDTEDNKEIFRQTIDGYLESLSADGYKIPRVIHNRTMLKLKNGSVLQYLVAGTRGSKELGTSRALNFMHATEVAKWSASVNIDSLEASLAETFPDRLYMRESTAKGFNHWRTQWSEAKDDPSTQRAFFIGWWAKEIYQIPKTDPRFAEVMNDDPTPEETELAATVEQEYNHIVTQQQLAWYRWRSQKRSVGEGSMDQEFPWHAEQAFVVTGNHFFPSRRLAADLKIVLDGQSVKFRGYRYLLGEQITTSSLDVVQLDPVRTSSQAHLRVWEEPSDQGVYAIGFDPAYGRTDWGDSHAIEVYRCFADKIVQVAEYATPDQETYQVIWVLAHLASMYQNSILNIEINGPGAAVFQGLRHLKAQLRAQSVMNGAPTAPGEFADALNGARWYLYHRPDSMGAGYAYGWKTQADNKLVIMNQMRDSYMLGHLIVRSGPMLHQMQTIVQDGSEIGAAGKGKDDQVFASCFAHKAWIEWLRPGLIAEGKTWAAYQETLAKLGREPARDNSLVGNIVRGHMRQQEEQRQADDRRRAFGQRVW